MITHTRVHFSTLILFSKYELRDFLLFPRETVFFVRCTCSMKNRFPSLIDRLNLPMLKFGASIFAER